ncbi:DUF2845 domain-containing protein [Halopseudomonas aestusnigri]|jgi:uncharacterized protein DUF2845|uniref:DUF2845 domain-containing protein n=1 Tax=Halopseudomonas TaxID=2901189 RepID=UPI000E9EFD39|nr:DUF2845 domain-containing protein [Halopseudomonas aestusnigri]HBT59108.1 hypothetical protein [Pseudomonas sp.]MCC4261805.1 DUF2845 domain-containing protein [Halopseudomonas aestusnigri]MCK5531774.1 DUF2845 domain-containing protein [Halopseudomonas aestusnigri]UGV30268.1 DUF2845 domain-containing protein [Halopseudomonas aestusnigri]HCP02496.1 hypothetical protein [Pseudomonas sp.]|tara:strand:+ start:2845 stop:3147 length:303 start_codon:yes stop_codon:yes gene_type:complete
MLSRSRRRALFAALLALLFSLPAHALRCGTSIVDEGDLKFEVLQACGEPISREVIGYVDSVQLNDRIRVMNIEEWIYQINGNYQSLEFEGNRLVRITRIR